MQEKPVVVIIPAYEPDEKMLLLLKQISCSLTQAQIIVVDDGSGIQKAELFTEAESYALILHHEKNQGKGSAIKTALSYIEKQAIKNRCIVIADADGQHTIDDIRKVAKKAGETDSFVLGCRAFIGNVPARSRFGNTVTRGIFRLATGVRVSDTQTGLRAFPVSMIPYMEHIEGERYEYEMNVLLQCARDKVNIVEVPIETVYIEENQSSHFRVIKDSCRIYKEILRFSCSSFLSFLIDYGMYWILHLLCAALGVQQAVVPSNLGARVVSSICNYSMNKRYVFQNKENIVRSAIRYFTLVLIILAMNTILLLCLVHTVLPNVYLSKILVECIMFFVSYTIQKHYVFHMEKESVEV
ncbi:bifunctional glycosyltransferase family 2/GtrA family protein [Anaerosporobacter faecicola]|uniref:bifunctional glycosyltransferase family 2/GtrA family protein n=1 Tax=Anaerosporobacter faecicola TaxID=2718714 RepID=UPI0014394F64|nr:bifunctional glycosyltransferase family 2/GtrA family protein [Anaerosporobacter faecicola]